MRIAIFIISLVTAAFAEPQHNVVPGWPKLPEGHVLGLCAGVGVDAPESAWMRRTGCLCFIAADGSGRIRFRRN